MERIIIGFGPHNLTGVKLMPAFTANEQNLVNLFQRNIYLFEIPAYQRPYSWEIEHVSVLLEDLRNAMEQDSTAPYFMGSIVLIKEENSPESEVIDGQQRLTTLTMLLCVLRDLASDNTKKSEIDQFIVEAGNSLTGTQNRFRINLRERDKSFFQNNVQSMEALEKFLAMDKARFSDSQQRIFENVGFLYKKLSEYSETERNSLARYLVQQCYLIVVATPDNASAHRIFSVLNDRGLNLSPTDILKSDIIGAMASPEEEHTYNGKWEDIEESLTRDKFREFFAHIRMIHLKSKLRNSLQYDFQRHILNEISGEKARDFIDNVLEPYSDAYRIVSGAAYESSQDAEQVNRYLRYLGRIDNFDWIPPAMAFFKRCQDDHAKLVQFTKDLERLVYGLFIRRASVNERISRYGKLLIAIEKEDDLWGGNAPLQLNSGEKAEILQQLDGPMYLQTRVCQPVLLRLDSLLADTGARYDYTVISVEHVLPQKPEDDSEWALWFPNSDTREHWTHRLANLVLLSWKKNARASNRDFETKKREYFQRGNVSPFAITTQVINESKWTPLVLQQRQEELLNALKKEWRLE